MAKICIDKDCVSFFVNFPNDSNSIDEKKIFEEAVNRAYRDMSSHTLHYAADKYKGENDTNGEHRQGLKNEVVEKLFSQKEEMFGVITKEAFDEWHHKFCQTIIEGIFTAVHENIKPINIRPGTLKEDKEEEDSEIQNAKKDNSFDMDKTFSYGQAQKLLNMTIKYIYMFYHYFNAVNGIFGEEVKKFGNIINFLHMPVDGYVIRKIGETATECKRCDLHQKRKRKCFNITTSDNKFNGQVWSKFSYGDYNRFRECVKSNLPNVESVFIWELKNWPFWL